MISNKQKETAQWALNYAKQKGCSDAKVRLSTNQQTEISLENLKVDKLQNSSSNGLNIDLYVDGRYGSCSTNRLEQKEIASLIDNAINTTRRFAPDPHRRLPNQQLIYQGGKPDLEQYDEVSQISPEEKMTLVKQVGEEVDRSDKRIINVGSSYWDYWGDSYVLMTNGFEQEKRESSFGISSSISVKGEGESRPSDGWYESRMFYQELPKTGISKKALELVLRKIGQRKMPSGKYPMIVDTTVASQVFSPIIQAISSGSLRMKNSFLQDKMGEQIAYKGLNLYDRPHLIHASGARYYDHEGVATQNRTIISGGKLNTFFIDTYTANKLGMDQTISGPSILTLDPSSLSLEDLFNQAGKGIYVTGFNGGNSNPSTGDFSYGIEGFLIENGKLTQPINEMNITGNFIDLLQGLQAHANDQRDWSSWRIPSLLFTKVSFSGL